MRLIHLADLHIGKRVKGYSLIEDQKHILNQIIKVAKGEKADGIIIAGDIYDNSVPSIEAVNLFDDFICKINEKGIKCFIVSGNHDNVYRISFASGIMSKSGIYVAKKYNGTFTPIEINEDINIWLLPFIRPFEVREHFNEFQTSDYEEMMKTVLNHSEIDENKTNILVAHQFVTCNGSEPERSESETVSLGTIDNIDVSVFDKFDYVALGHIHKSQAMGRNVVRYAGSPLKYSFSEKNDKKSIVILDIEKKNINIKFEEFKPLKDMIEVSGYFSEIVKNERCEDYVKIILKDEDFIVDVKNKLEAIYPNIMEISYDNTYSKSISEMNFDTGEKKQSPLELFKTFYFVQNSKEINDNQENIINDVLCELDTEGNSR